MLHTRSPGHLHQRYTFLLIWLCLLTPLPLLAKSTDHIVLKTHNNMGYMAVTFDKITHKFLKFVKETKGTYLDAGAAFGAATRAALEAGAEKIIANDISASHIKILKSKIPPQDKEKVKTIIGDFPEGVTAPNNSLDGILMARLLHFFDGPKVEKSLKKAYAWLKPGGKAFIIVVSPHVYQLKQTRKIIAERKKNKVKWPGFFDNIWEVAPGFKNVTPAKFHVLTSDILTRELEKSGFKIIHTELSGFTPWAKEASPDSSEILGFIVQK